MRRALLHLTSAAIALPIVGASFAACSIGTGTGSVTGDLNVRDCWEGKFDLQPNFFAAVPYRTDSLQLRIQNGGDYETFSDGVSIQIDSVTSIREHPASGDGGGTGEIGVPLVVSLPAGVTEPGVPIVANPDPSIVHLTLYLQRTCRTQDVALYAMESVSLNSAGGCDPLAGGEPVFTCPNASSSSSPGTAPASWLDGGGQGGVTDSGMDATTQTTSPDAGPGDAAGPDASPSPGAVGPVGHSTIVFQSLFNNDETEPRADNRHNQGTFDVYLADPREVCPGGIGPPPPCRGHLIGAFDFYFERGRPAQPFP